MNVTDGDRERARELADLAYQSGYDQQFEPKPRDITDEQVIDRIATALAEEREKALRDAAAWFALQDDEGGPAYHAGPDRIPVYETHRWAAAHLTERAEESQ